MSAAGPEFQGIALILVAGAIAGAIALRARLPLLVSFIAIGVLLEPFAPRWLAPYDEIGLLGRLGIALLLFLVGLKLDPHHLRDLGPRAALMGVLQVGITAVAGFALARALGLPIVPAAYLAVALTFSSTAILVKLLADRHETEAVHGRVVVGLLIMQDVIVVLAMVAVTAASAGAGAAGFGAGFLAVALRAIALLALLALLMRLVLPRLLGALSRSHELLILFALAWALALASFADVLGLTVEIGAFLAGVAIASTAYRDAIASRLVPLRDFLLLFFFVELGTLIRFDDVAGGVAPALAVSAFVLLVKPLIVMLILGRMGYHRQTSFQAGVTMGQVSEFSFILVALGRSLGHVGSETLALLTLAGLGTIAISSYLINASGWLYARLEPSLAFIERKARRPRAPAEGASEGSATADVVVFGLGRYGSRIARGLAAQGTSVLGVDVDPAAIRRFTATGGHALYGHVGDPEFVEGLPLDRARWVVSAVPDRDANLALLHALRDSAFGGRVALRAQTSADAHVLESAGADVILRPFSDAAREAVRELASSGARDREGGRPPAGA